MKAVARLSFLLTTCLFATFYAVAKEALGRMDPVVFTFFEVIVLVPIALALVILHWRDATLHLLKRGVILGSCLCLAMLTMTVSLKYTQAANTAFLPSIGGIVGAAITGAVFKRRLTEGVWIAGTLSLLGVIILLLTAGGGIELRGDLIALLGALFFTVYLFLVDFDRNWHTDQPENKGAFWLVLGMEHLTTAFWMAFIALLFGDWQYFHPIWPKDIEIFIYTGVATTFVPVVLSMYMQRYIDPLEAAFISTLEPIFGVLIAYLYLSETLPVSSYIGGGLVVAGAIFHTWSSARNILPSRVTRRFFFLIVRYGQYIVNAKATIIGCPILLLSGGVLLLYWLGGFPPSAWLDLTQNLITNGQATFIVLPWIRAICWGISWGTLLLISGLTAIVAAQRLLSSTDKYVQPSPAAYLAKDRSVRVKSIRTTRKLNSPVAQRRQLARTQRLGM